MGCTIEDTRDNTKYLKFEDLPVGTFFELSIGDHLYLKLNNVYCSANAWNFNKQQQAVVGCLTLINPVSVHIQIKD